MIARKGIAACALVALGMTVHASALSHEPGAGAPHAEQPARGEHATREGGGDESRAATPSDFEVALGKWVVAEELRIAEIDADFPDRATLAEKGVPALTPVATLALTFMRSSLDDLARLAAADAGPRRTGWAVREVTQRYRAAARVVRAESWRALRAGENERAASMVLTQIDLARHFRTLDGVMHAMITRQFLSAAIDDAHRVIDAAGPDGPHARVIVAALDRLGPDPLDLLAAFEEMRPELSVDALRGWREQARADARVAANVTQLHKIDLANASDADLAAWSAGALRAMDEVRRAWRGPDAGNGLRALQAKYDAGEFGPLAMTLPVAVRLWPDDKELRDSIAALRERVNAVAAR